MFLNALEKQNPALIDAALSFWQRGQIKPDSYVIDVDQLLANARLILAEATRHGIQLYAMSKQIGRNPWLCQQLLDCGYHGIVAVDFKELRQLQRYGVPVAHIGHLVQPPEQMIPQIVAQRPAVITVFSLEKARSIAAAAEQTGWVQPVLLKVMQEGDLLYSGQEGGFPLGQLTEVLAQLNSLVGIKIIGVTHFPCMQFNPQLQRTLPTSNMQTLLQARDVLQQQGICVEQVNAPSASSCETLPQLAALGVTHVEPGHALTGSIPANQQGDCAEKVAMLYLSEISHHYAGRAYCFGGGYYQRGNLAQALVIDQQRRVRDQVLRPEPNNIDYYLELTQVHPIGSAVVMCFRTQIFVTRSDVVLIRGIACGEPYLQGIYDSQGNPLPMESR